jgi:hypothetical protein
MFEPIRHIPRFLILLILLIPITLSTGSAVFAAGAAEVVADRLWQAYEKVPWGVPYEAWSVGNDSTPCVQVEDGWGWGADDEFCYRCDSKGDAQTSVWYFYTYDQKEPLACRLERFDCQIARSWWYSSSDLREAHQILEERFSSRFGSPESPEDFVESGSAAWRESRRWEATGFHVYLYLSVSYGSDEPQSVCFQIRHQPLVEERRWDDRFRWSRSYGWWRGIHGRVIHELTAQLEAEFPGIRAYLAGNDSLQAYNGKIPELLESLLTKAQAADEEQVPKLLLVADAVAELMPEEPFRKKKGPWRLDSLTVSGRKLTYEYSPLGDAWVYTHDLLWGVWREYGQTDMGEWAFVILLEKGWYTGCCCGSGNEFEDVITQGEVFLRERPDSPRRTDVELLLALAYETHWAQSQTDWASEQFGEGADASLAKAIAYYEAVLEAVPPDSYEAFTARRQLPRLKLGINTAQSRFSCFYD